jgi:hypothetical protein
MEQKMDKVTLLEKMRSRQAGFEELLGALSTEQLTTPGVNGTWSIKDILAHLSSWQQHAQDRLQAAANGVGPSTPPVTSVAEIDDLNARFYAENKARTLPEVMADFKNTYRQVFEGVQAVSEEDLSEPNRFAWLKGTALWEVVADNTYGHIEEHLGAIEAWLETTGRSIGRA